MDFKDYYATLGVKPAASQDEIKRAYRKLARKYHPDVSKEADAEARFKEIAEAYAALNSAEKRAAYDDIGKRYKNGQDFNPPSGWDSGFEFSGRDFGESSEFGGSEFFEAIFGRQAPGRRGSRASGAQTGEDHHAKVQISLQDAYRGGHRTITLRMPQMDASGQMGMQERQLEVNIPKGIRAGQHLRFAGQGSLGFSGGAAGDLYLEVGFAASPQFRVDDRDVYVTTQVSPWEAALGASIPVQTPDGRVQMTVPRNSSQGRKLRLKGKGLPSTPPGDLYAELSIVLPPADTLAALEAYRLMSTAFASFDPRSPLEA